jgi:hypothetical protein
MRLVPSSSFWQSRSRLFSDGDVNIADNRFKSSLTGEANLGNGGHGDNGFTQRNQEAEDPKVPAVASTSRERQQNLHARPSVIAETHPATFNDVTGAILASAIEVHRTLGPGLLESIYLHCLQFELASRKLRFVVQRPIAIVYKGSRLDASYRIDLIVEDLVVVEVKVSCGFGARLSGRNF